MRAPSPFILILILSVVAFSLRYSSTCSFISSFTALTFAPVAFPGRPSIWQIFAYATAVMYEIVRLACVASVPVRKKSSQTIFRKQAARKLGREIPSISRPNFRAACLRKIVWELFFRTGTLATQAIVRHVSAFFSIYLPYFVSRLHECRVSTDKQNWSLEYP